MPSSRGTVVRVPPPEWSDERLEEDRTKAIEAFRNERLTEPLESWLRALGLREAQRTGASEDGGGVEHAEEPGEHKPA